jgi:hypothetical protein
MGKYVLAYSGGGMPETEEEQARVMGAWTDWLGSLGDSLVDAGTPFGASKTVANGSLADGARSRLTGYSIVTAGTLDEAAGKTKSCPVLDSGGTIDVYETIDVM